jgi:predicted hydrolase (HD superfamily)
MQYNREAGMSLLKKYLANDAKKFCHSVDVGNCAFMFAEILSQKHPELGIDKDIVGFLGYAHDIGQAKTQAKHEVITIQLLTEEGIPRDIARKTMHGQLYEQFGHEVEDSAIYLPSGVEGKIITVVDMSVDPKDGIISIEDRAKRIKAGIMNIPNMPGELKERICACMDAALPRFKEYRDDLFSLMDLSLKELHDRFEREYRK